MIFMGDYSSMIRERAIANLQKAVDFDTKEDFSQSLQYYKIALNDFDLYFQLEKDDTKIKIVENSIAPHRQRLAQLNLLFTIVGEASQLLEAAIEQDEKLKRFNARKDEKDTLLEQYMKAVEKYMEAIKISSSISPSNSEKGTTSGTLKSWRLKANLILDRISELKNVAHDPPPLATTPPAQPKSSPTLQNSSPAKPTSSIKTSCPKPYSPPASLSNKLILNRSTDGLQANEINVLKTSSVVNGKLFQPWIEGEETFEKFRCDRPWSDPDGLLPLSRAQIDAGVSWKRPSEFLPIILESKATAKSRQSASPSSTPPSLKAAGGNTSEEQTRPVMISQISPLSITQDLVTDCSFVASLCITAAFEMKLKQRLITAIIYPQDQNGNPVYNPCGKYLVKLFFNGVFRKVLVDDYLPFSETSGRLLCSFSSNPRELWVSIIEKAYLKVNGGYDFPGSNSGIDLYALTGWIPEKVFFQEDEFESSKNGREKILDHQQSEERAWQRLHSAHGFGDCLITISTPPEGVGDGFLSLEQQEATGLVPGHAYAVLNVVELKHLRLRMLLVKNPWARRPWKGRYSSADSTSWTSEIKAALGVTNESVSSLEKQGVFWMDFYDCRRYFKSFYLNWNPALFSYRITLHDSWPVTRGPAVDTYYSGDNPQYLLKVDGCQVGSMPGCSPRGASIWILLSRHVMVTNGKESRRATAEDSKAADDEDEDFLAVHIFRTNKRVYDNPTPLVRGVYTNNPHTLVRFDVDPQVFPPRGDAFVDDTQAFVLMLSQMRKRRDISYSLTVLATTPFRIHSAPLPPPQKVSMNGKWDSNNNGGSPVSESFYINPQYKVIIPSPMSVHCQIQYPKEVSGGLHLLRMDGPDSDDRVDTVIKSAVVLQSGPYSKGYSFFEGPLEPGVYRLVLSTYRRTDHGPFILTFSSDSPCSLIEVPPEGAGMNRQGVNGSWSGKDGTAVGCSNYGNYQKNPIIPFRVTEPLDLLIRMRAKTSGISADSTDSYDDELSINMALYHISPSPDYDITTESIPRSESLASSQDGKYTNRPCGVVLRLQAIAVGTYILVPSTFEPAEALYKLLIYSSKGLTISSPLSSSTTNK